MQEREYTHFSDNCIVTVFILGGLIPIWELQYEVECLYGTVVMTSSCMESIFTSF